MESILIWWHGWLLITIFVFSGAQIRQATSQALKNISDSSTKLMKNPINRPSGSSNDNKASTSRRPDVQVRQPGPRQDEGAPPRHAAQTSAPAETSRSAKKPNRDSEKSSADQNRDIKTKKRVRSESQERPAVPTGWSVAYLVFEH